MTPKQARFVEEYLLDLNATQAAIRAGFSEKTANEQGAQLLKKPEIMAAIDAGKVERSEQANIDAIWVLKRLVEEAEADLADLYDDNGNLLPVEDWPLIFRQGLVQGVEVEELFEGQGSERKHIGRVKKIRLDSRIKRVEMIGRHVRVNAFQENVHHTGLDGLGDRLERAKARLGDRIIEGTSERIEQAIPARSAPLPLPEPSPSPAPVREPKPAAPDPAPPPAPITPAAGDWIAPSATYAPILPAKQAFADDYENGPDGFLFSYRNTGDYDDGC